MSKKKKKPAADDQQRDPQGAESEELPTESFPTESFPEETEVLVDDTVLMNEAQLKEQAGAVDDAADEPPGFTETEELPQDLGPGAEPGLRSTATPEPFSETESFEDTEVAPTEAHLPDASDESDEVLVLLPEDDDSVDAVPVVETAGVEQAPWGDETEQGNFTAELGLGSDAFGTESIEEIGLKTSNPLNRTDAIEEFGDAEDYSDTDQVGGVDGTVGVIEEIAELANSLDEEILDADHVDGGFDDGAQGGDFGEFDAPARRSSKLKILFFTGTVAAAVAAGVVYFPEIRTWVDQFMPAKGTTVVQANSGNPDGGPQVIAPPDNPQTGTDPSGTGVDTIEPPAAEVSLTRKSVRESMFLAMELGVQWDEGEE